MIRTLRDLPIRRLFVVPAVVAGLTFAGSGGPASAAADACPTTNAPNELALAGGTPQTSKLHTPFADMFQVTLANTNGCPLTTEVAGSAVTFTAPSSGASGTFSASGSNTVTVGANASGGANAPPFTANGSAGSYTVTASSNYGSVSFSLTNTAAGIAASITAGAPTSQTAIAGGRYAEPLQATVLDANGNPVEGVGVTFALGSGTGGAGGGAGSTGSAAGASFDGGSTQATEITNASGTATSPLFTANGTAGAFTATAATADVVEPAGFSLDNLAGTPPTITALTPAKQAAVVGAHYGKPLQVKVVDESGKPIQGASVTFALGTSGGGGNSTGGTAGASFDGGAAEATETTDAAGIATSPLFIANGSPGTFTATATTTGTTKAVTFSLDNLDGKQSTIAAAGPAKRSATVAAGFRTPLQVKVRNGSGKPVPGTTVTFTLGSTGGGAGSASGAAGASFVGGASTATATTNTAGVATSPRLTANTVAGTFDATATTAGSTEAATFALRNLPARPATITAGVAATESTVVGTRFPIRLAVTVEDAHANPVAGVVVTFVAPTRGPGGHFDGTARRTVKVKTDAIGVAVAPPFRANHSRGGYIVRAVVHGAVRGAAFALVNQAPS